jgi:peptidoglycan hydrolase-like protein with peptidoglycan-binding domain
MKKIFITATILLLPFAASAATLSLSPFSQSVNVGDTFSINVNLDTQNVSIDGVDLRYINYNPALLQVQDSNTSASGVQIVPGTLMPATLANIVDASLGRITFSQVAAGGNKYKGIGVLATINFKALSAGTDSVTFNYASANTKDSNVAAAGVDVLTAVTNGSYTINATSNTTNTTTTTTSSSGGGGGGGGGGSGSSSGSSGSSSGSVGYTYPVSSSAPIVSHLSLGTSGAEVTSLQNFLVSQGYLTAGNVTGSFNSATQIAVQSFQKAQGIVSSGSPETTGYGDVGPSTRAKINAIIGISASSVTPITSQVSVSGAAPITRRLIVGSSGSDVVVLQDFLRNKGYMISSRSSGYFGPVTEEAVQSFQKANGIVSSGSPDTTGYGAVGPSTRSAINALLGATSSVGTTSDNAALQAQMQILQAQVNALLLLLQQVQ